VSVAKFGATDLAHACVHETDVKQAYIPESDLAVAQIFQLSK